MTKLRMIRATAAVVGGLTFAGGVGVVGASPMQWFGGHGSHNGGNSTTSTVANDSTVGLNNKNTQVAKSGDATVSSSSKDSHNNWWNRDNDNNNDPAAVKSASTGNAVNSNKLSAGVSVDQSSDCGCATPAVSGTNTGSSTVKTAVTNTSDVKVSNTNDQYAKSGDASVSGNNTAGSASTGNASNSNDATISVTVKQ